MALATMLNHLHIKANKSNHERQKKNNGNRSEKQTKTTKHISNKTNFSPDNFSFAHDFRAISLIPDMYDSLERAKLMAKGALHPDDLLLSCIVYTTKQKTNKLTRLQKDELSCINLSLGRKITRTPKATSEKSARFFSMCVT